MCEEIEIPDGWIKHDGGECPVGPEAQVDGLFRDGYQYCLTKAKYWNWSHFGNCDDIIAYRLSEAQP